MNLWPFHRHTWTPHRVEHGRYNSGGLFTGVSRSCTCGKLSYRRVNGNWTLDEIAELGR